ncbi:MAG TPA: hypothetical protein V6D07_15530 [Trichocoleus sp.]
MHRKLIGYLTVDSGQLFITDPGYLRNWQHGEYTQGVEPDNSYARVTTFMFENDGYGEIENGIVVGVDGDGYYPVYALEDEDGHLIKLEVVFQPEQS